jgi:membrane-bound acyltransferase YfiQ involved in biofilm formation
MGDIMFEKKLANEIFILRSIACLAVVFMHAISTTVRPDFYIQDISVIARNLMSIVSLGLIFATPTFVFISEFLLSLNYSNELKSGFLIKRLKYIGIPFVVFSFIYGWYEVKILREENSSVFVAVVKNIFLGDFFGYFVLIIFQFYILHTITRKFLAKASPLPVLISSFVINFGYLCFFRFIKPLEFVPYSDIIWERLYWIPFLGWLFYFTMAFYAGRYYEEFKIFLNKLSYPILIGSLVATYALSGILSLLFSEYFHLSSKRPDVLIYTTLIILLILKASKNISNIPNFISVISQYSYGIFLTHMIFMHVFYFALNKVGIHLGAFYVYTFCYFFVGVVLPIIFMYLLNRIPFGEYVMGKVGVRPLKKK